MMKYVGIVVLTGLVTFCLMEVWDVHDYNRFFHVECQTPNGGAVYGPGRLVRDDRIGLLANQFCSYATPMIRFEPLR